MIDRLLTQEEAAQVLAVKPRTLEGWRVTGAGPRFIRISARCIRYRRPDLDTWLNERIALSTSDAGRRKAA